MKLKRKHISFFAVLIVFLSQNIFAETINEPKVLDCEGKPCIFAVKEDGSIYRAEWEKLSDDGFNIVLADSENTEKTKGEAKDSHVSMLITNIDDVTAAIGIINVVFNKSDKTTSIGLLSSDEENLITVKSKTLGIDFDINETEGIAYSGATLTQENFFDGRLGLAIASHNFEACADVNKNCKSEDGAFVGLSFKVK
jgi:hypothetical protein